MAIRFIPLGGLGEFGLNTMVIEVDSERIVIDSGIMFPDPNLGVDYIIPDFRYLTEEKKKISAVLLTHGHEDHIGGIPFLLKQVSAPLYATPFTAELIKKKFDALEMKEPIINVIKPDNSINIGKIKVEFIRVDHSIPDACAIALHTSCGIILNSGDFRIDPKSKSNSVKRFGEIGKKKVTLLLSDSTNIEVKSKLNSEKDIPQTLEKIFANAEGRIFVGLFASHINRIQEFINVSKKFKRKIAFLGRSIQENVTLALKLKYLHLPSSNIIPSEKISKIPPSELTIIATGTQGERGSALLTLSMGENSHVKINKGDILVHSARIVPGNELSVSFMFDGFYRQGATIIDAHDKMIHVSGHGGSHDQKQLINLIKPRFFVPIHGNYRFLVKHAELAQNSGLSSNRIFVMENGDCLEIENNNASVKKLLKIDRNFVESGLHGDISSALIKTRKQLARGGVVIVVVLKITKQVHIICKGVTESDELIKEMKQATFSAISKKNIEFPDPHDAIRVFVRRLLEKRISKRPLVIPTILDV